MYRHYLLAALFMAPLWIAAPCRAAFTNWTVQANSSSLTITGGLSSGGALLSSVRSSPGANVSGSFDSQQQFGQFFGPGNVYYPTHLQVVSGMLDFLNVGSFDPLPGGGPGTAPADGWISFNLGGGSGLNVAVRDMVLDLFSDPFQLLFDFPGDYSQIVLGRRYIEVQSGSADYRGFGSVGTDLGSGTLSFAGDVELAGYFGNLYYSSSDLSGLSTLVLGIDFTLTDLVLGGDTIETSDDVELGLQFNGLLRATAPIAAVPESNAFLFVGMASCVAICIHFRKKHGVLNAA